VVSADAGEALRARPTVVGITARDGAPALASTILEKALPSPKSNFDVGIAEPSMP